MADVKLELKFLARFLGVSGLRINVNSETKVPVVTLNGTAITGLGSACTYLAKAAGRQELIGGNDASQRATVSQWLEYRVAELSRCQGEKDLSTVLKELNTYLESRTFFCGDHLTLPDLLIAYGLRSALALLTFQEKERYLHLCRWYDNVQSIEGVLQKEETPIYFMKNLLYAGVLS